MAQNSTATSILRILIQSHRNTETVASAKANLLDDGVADTFVLAGATSAVLVKDPIHQQWELFEKS
jgi:hypothetical protein